MSSANIDFSGLPDQVSRLEKILKSPQFAPNIVIERKIPATEGSYVPLPEDLDARIRAALEKRGISRIYTHQGEVWENVRRGLNTVVVTPTASGKTLCYNLPVLDALLKDEKARALYLFPTKALSQDQQSELNETITGAEDLKIKAATYDGDTPDSLRISIRDTGRIVISNPDMLHAGILPNHPKWVRFFSGLKYIVIDEAHAYRGVLGSHVANVIRRLKRIANFYGSKPQFILCSATIANPQELAQSLIGEDAVLVGKNGAPGGSKRIILYNPPLVDAVQGIRRSVINESQRWMLAFLQAGIKTILFAHSRIKTEVAASYVNQDLKNIYTGNSGIRVETYRGGLLPTERREIEKGLRDGSIQGVVSTNALELGIDIGGLDASIVAGFPGSFNSFWQQSGRAGRRGGTSVAVFVASASPIDQFIMNEPEWFFGKSMEEARLDPSNPYILSDHVKCASFELPFRDDVLEKDEDSFNKDEAVPVLEYLEEEGTVRHVSGKWHWADRSYPAEAVSLRTASADNIVIVNTTKGKNEVIGEMDRPGAKEMLFDKAVYMHRGRQFIVEKLDIENRKCSVTEAEVNYYTDGVIKTDIKVLTEDELFSFEKDKAANADTAGAAIAGKAVLGDILVRTQAVKFKKFRFHTNENIGFGEIDVPEEEMQTRALTLLFGNDTEGGKALSPMDEAVRGAVLSGVGILIRQIAPVFLLCDPRDLGTSERVRDLHFEVPCLYIYDKYPGGTGLAESLAGRLDKLFAAIYRAVKDCPCRNGCPSCVGPEGNKEATAQFLSILSS